MALVDYVSCPQCGNGPLRVRWRADVENPDSKRFEDCEDGQSDRSPTSTEQLRALKSDRLRVFCTNCSFGGPYRAFPSIYGFSGFQGR